MIDMLKRHEIQVLRRSDLKADLRKLNEHFLTFPEEQRAKGIWAFASRPPVDGDFLVSKLWDEYLPDWRNPKKAKSPEETKKLLKEFNEDGAAPPSAKPTKMNDADFVMIERVYPFRRGSWQIVPPGTKSLPKR